MGVLFGKYLLEVEKEPGLRKLKREIFKNCLFIFLEQKEDMTLWYFSVVKANSCSKSHHHTGGIWEETRGLPVSIASWSLL